MFISVLFSCYTKGMDKAKMIAELNAYGALAIGFLLLLFVIWITALVDVTRRKFDDPSTKVVWALVVVLLHFIGAVIYFAFGRKQGRLP